MLFEEYGYFTATFPEPQYLGSKHILTGWLAKFIPSDARVALDAFGGSQSVAFMLKRRGITTLTNDFLRFNHMIGLALIENNSAILTSDDIELLFSERREENYTLMKDTFTNVFFNAEQAEFLDQFRSNVELLVSPYKRALAITVMNRSLTRKVTMGHFAHTQALNYANNPERVKRNRSLARPIQELFLELLPKYNLAVFDNRSDNKSYNENILSLLPALHNANVAVDVAYFDPPYCDSHANYQSFYHLLETYTEYWRDKQFINTTKRYEPQRYSGFDKKQDTIESFKQLFQMSVDIPYWLVSFNNRSYPAPNELAAIISRYKDVSIETHTYRNGRGGKGSVAGSQEILFVCKNKAHSYIPSHFMEHIAFSYWQQCYNNDELGEFATHRLGQLWLKIKSITRRELMNSFLQKFSIQLSNHTLNAQFQELYTVLSSDVETAHSNLDDFIREKHREICQTIDVQSVVSELYELRSFDWGGDYANALDRYLVDRYIKVYQRFNDLQSKLETEIPRAVQGYVLCSWYNHWSSIVIENIFKSHSSVLPTVGQIKKVDFFINDVPFDLKVTYLPANFIETKRRERGLRPELVELKRKAREANIIFNDHRRSDDTYYEIVEKMKERRDDICLNALESIKSTRMNILDEVRANPRLLIRNLYEEQGELRFDASNRLFLVLVDTEDFDNSWKLKRNLEELQPAIMNYLDAFSSQHLDEKKISFRYRSRTQDYTALSDIIFVIK
jgi:adenine-specific DNA-methyltransferase